MCEAFRPMIVLMSVSLNFEARNARWCRVRSRYFDATAQLELSSNSETVRASASHCEVATGCAMSAGSTVETSARRKSVPEFSGGARPSALR